MFKVGDRVKLICKFAYGTLGTVVDVPTFSQKPGDVYVKRDPAGPTDCLRYHESELELVKPTTTPHKHAALIKAWADCPSLVFQWRSGPRATIWHNFTGEPDWSASEIRIKPEPKPDVVSYAFINKVPKGYPEGLNRNGFYDVGPLQLTTRQTPPDNVKLTFDGETGKLKSVELLS